MGVVLATEFFLARLAALQRAQIVYDLVLSASRLVENRLPGPGNPVPPWDLHAACPTLAPSMILRDLRGQGFLVVNTAGASDEVLDLTSLTPVLQAMAPLTRPLATAGGEAATNMG